MLKKVTRQEKVKASLWMRRSDYEKLGQMSGDYSFNAFVVSQLHRLILTAEEEEEEEQRKKELALGQPLPGSPRATSRDVNRADSQTPQSANPGGEESVGK